MSNRQHSVNSVDTQRRDLCASLQAQKSTTRKPPSVSFAKDIVFNMPIIRKDKTREKVYVKTWSVCPLMRMRLWNLCSSASLAETTSVVVSPQLYTCVSSERLQ